MSIAKIVGRRVRSLRKKQGLTQDGLAEASSLSAKYIGEIERASVNLTIQSLEQLADALGIKVDELLKCDHEDDIEVVRQAVIDYVSQCSESDVRLAYKIMAALRW